MPSQIERLNNALRHFSPISHLEGYYDNEIDSLLRLCEYAIECGWKMPQGFTFPRQINENSFKRYYHDAINVHTLGYHIEANLGSIEKIALGKIDPENHPDKLLWKKAHLYNRMDAVKFLIQYHPYKKQFIKYLVPFLTSFYESVISAMKDYTKTTQNVTYNKTGDAKVPPNHIINKKIFTAFHPDELEILEQGNLPYSKLLKKHEHFLDYSKELFGNFFFEYHYVFKLSQRMEEWSRLEAAFYGQLVKSALEFAAVLQKNKDKKIIDLIERLRKNTRLLKDEDLFCKGNMDTLNEDKPFDNEYRYWPMLKSKHYSTAISFTYRLLEENKLLIKSDLDAINKMISGYYDDYDWLFPNRPNIAFWPLPPSR